MGFTEDEKAKILAALREKAPRPGPCPICGNPNWSLQDGLVRLVVQEEVTKITLGGRNFPCVAITCANCGNTQLINLIILGLRHLIEKEEKPKGAKKEKAE